MWHILKRVARGGIATEPAPAPALDWRTEAQAIESEILAILGRSLAIRVVDSGSCNACELEINALSNPYYNIESLGIKLVASPRHADMLLVTGPVSRHMEVALRRTYDAMPSPKLVVAVGECGANGGPFGETYATCGGVANVIPVDVVIPGCPPPPLDLLRGILAAVRQGERSAGGATPAPAAAEAPPATPAAEAETAHPG